MGDSNFRWRSVDRVVAETRELAAKAGTPARITVEHPDVPHRFPAELRQQAYRLLDDVLRK